MPKKLLLADDSITIQKMVATAMAGQAYELTVVDNGDDAIVQARKIHPDVILADVVMPKRNGYDVCHVIKTDPLLKGIPVILLAGTFEAFDETRARAAQADGHIAKPFEVATLLAKVDSLVARGDGPVPDALELGARAGFSRSAAIGTVVSAATVRGVDEPGTVPGLPHGAVDLPAPGDVPATDAVVAATRALVERIAREIIPPLVEQAIREHVERLAKQRQP